jgi:LPS-assembly protein
MSSKLGPFAALALVFFASADARAEALVLKLAREIAPPSPNTAPAASRVPGQPAPPVIARDDTQRGVVFLRADRLEGTVGEVTAEGKVELRTQRETVLADQLSYDFKSETIDADGNVTLRRGYDWISGPSLEYKRDTETGRFNEPHFLVSEANARGDASEIRFAGPEKYEASDASYTTCVAPNRDWYLRTEELELDTLRKVGTAHRASLYFLDARVIYTPWLEFPLSNQRKSGFLTPTFGSTGVRGIEVSTPYYLNLAPNYDATITPRLMTKRGLMLGGQFRYLLGDEKAPLGAAAGEINAEFLPHDHVTGDNRYAFAWKHNEQFTPTFAGFWNLNKVSDDTYFADFSDRIAVTSQKTLPREAGFVSTRGPLSLLARVQGFQTLQDPNAPVLPPYNRLPQVLATLQDTEWAGLTFSGIADYSRFSQAQLNPTGDRYVLYPTVAWNRQGAWWFVTARAGLHLRQYDLNDPVVSPLEANPHVAVPITSLDGGLTFEREVKIAGLDLTQTLEPRAFYVYIPFKRQEQTPVFDTALDDFNFSQLFAENRYLGNDRIGDANQLTLALTSRFLDAATGAERLRLAVGQRFYYADQRVTLGGEVPRSAATSDFLVGADGRLSDEWALTSLLQYNFDQSEVERLNVGGRYTPAPGKALSATWRYTRQLLDPTTGLETIKQIDLAGQWPVADRWTLLGRWNYSLQDKKTLEAVFGVEYNADCWVLRIVGQRLTTTTQQTSSSIFVQIELNGLARVGTSPLELLRRSVPGYLPTNDPSLRTRDRRYDPLPEF